MLENYFRSDCGNEFSDTLRDGVCLMDTPSHFLRPGMAGFCLPLCDGSAVGVDFKFIEHIAVGKMALVFHASIILFKEKSNIRGRGTGHTIHDCLAGRVFAYKAFCTGSRTLGSMHILAVAYDRTVCLADFIVVFCAVRSDKFYLKDHESIVTVCFYT